MKEYVRRERNDIPVEVDDDEIDLLQLAGTLWRGKWIMLLCAAVATFIGGYYAYEVAVPREHLTNLAH